MQSQSATLSAPGNSRILMHDLHRNPVNITQEIIIPGGVTASGVKVQHSLTDPTGFVDEAAYAAAAVWFDHQYLVALTASAIGNTAFPIRASRMVAAALTGGTVTYRATQAGIRGG